MIVIIWNFFFIPVSFILQVKTSDGWGGPEVQAEKKGGAADQTGHFGLRLDRFRDDQSDTCPPFP